MEKDEILANMYALRAGLSVVAVNSDKVDKAIKKAKNKAKELETNARDKKDQTLKTIESNDKKAKSVRRELAELNDAKKTEKSNNSREAGRAIGRIIWIVVKFIVLLGSIVGSAYCIMFWSAWYKFSIENESLSGIYETLYGWGPKFIEAGAGWATLAAAVVTLIAIAATIGALIWLIKSDWHFMSIDRRTKKLRKGKDIESDIIYYKSMSSELKATLRDHDKEIEKAIDEGKNIVADACLAEAPRATAAMQLYDGLKETFSKFLDERDWDNLDLLTYYIETGRADTVKESLQLLDRQKQTEQIVSAVNEAAGAICRSVKAGLANLKNDMRKCFNILSEQINDVSYSVNSRINEMNSKLASVESSVASQNARLADIASVASFNSALAAKSNVSSPQLMESVKTVSDDLHYITEQQKWAMINRGGYR